MCIAVFSGILFILPSFARSDEPAILTIKTNNHRSVVFSPDGRKLVTAGGGRLPVIIWNAINGEKITNFGPDHFGVIGVAFSPDGKMLAMTAYKEPGRVWDTKTWKVRSLLKDARGGTKVVAFSPDGKTLATVGQDDSIRLCDPLTGKEKAGWATHGDRLNCAAFSPDGKQLAVASLFGKVGIWDIKTRKLLQTLDTGKRGLIFVGYCLGGKSIVTANLANQVLLWSAQTGEKQKQLDLGKRNFSWIEAAAISPDGKKLAVGGLGPKVHLWDLQKGIKLATFGEFIDVVEGVAFSPDGVRLATTCRDGNTRVYNIPRKREKGNVK